ncbi:MAG: pilus assembly protein PilP [Burkholderiales bacterium]|nr:pilus assembly protein PilP [Burkholderiales bacterium]
MDQQGAGQRGKIDPIPEVQEYQPFAYNAYDIQDPFLPRKINVDPDREGGPDIRRAPEPLEAFPLESLTMVGTLSQNKATFGLIRTPSAEIYQVSVGNYMGQNHGKIVSITETEIQLTELVQDGVGDWANRSNSVWLIESTK